MDLAGGSLEIDVVIRDDSRETLRDPPQRNCGS
jgi:hypothetical protein